ncbi:16S rRNA (uracil(1498)-N(3))-methyltransferase [Bartonella tamiae]|uniref:Ribosomal RNA small subunit methyltransferase E n=1 Tax=Bartonella tamiae Th239 TaxID=1094558 RepID=J0R1E9_9HYPH|nr:16S rRNA (uracil(1498)-N(3))-methyltransferase [Bartonella tamiae]EJF89379.1 RsmE family RNA methyltransferase [Bartonella tamiae Th239]EJF92756.1 RsmE family RNA methyltransferase [Bartonella tamiae Th307]
MRDYYKLQRLYIDQPFVLNEAIQLADQKAHYLIHVLRMKETDSILLFNGQDGEWLAHIHSVHKKRLSLELIKQVRPQPLTSHLKYCFAPLKHARFDYMIQKAVEMGVSSLQPVITDHTQVTRINHERMKANAIEAAEQCGILDIPQCLSAISLEKLLNEWSNDGYLIFCDETDKKNNPLPILQALDKRAIAVLVGPEGGFSKEEQSFLKRWSFVIPIPLGPRILRADTAAIAALSVINATLGDWTT